MCRTIGSLHRDLRKTIKGSLVLTCTHASASQFCQSTQSGRLLKSVTTQKHGHPSIQEIGLAINSMMVKAARVSISSVQRIRPSTSLATIPRERRQTAAITGFENDGNSGSHVPDSHATSPAGITPRIQMLDLIH